MADTAADAAAAAAAAANRASTIELWTLYSIGVLVTVLRTYARVKAVGFKNLRADDYIVWFSILVYSTQSALAYNVGNVAHGLANNGMTDEQRAALSSSDPEFELRHVHGVIIGSKIQVAGWTTYSLLICSLKAAMLVFYTRLTDGLGRRYRIRIYIGFGVVLATLVASVVTVFFACRPFQNYWQISPDPGNACQAAISKPIIWVSFTANVASDIYIILIPIPLLWESTLRLYKKIASTVLLSAGIFVLVCAILKSVFVLVDPVQGAQIAGAWGTRETFVAVVTTNLPMIYPLLRNWLKPFLGSTLNSSQKAYRTPTGFRTIGGGTSEPHSRNRRGPPSASGIADLTFTESEERIFNDVKLQNMKTYASPATPVEQAPKGIVISSEFEITEDRRSHIADQRAERVHESW
ncbi:hypothetical protein GQ53DRAFT_692894 [Thozetella sp. PMI_491]|nr:hypothetical protein GQ53DRAFT_692894 [Thozetella sp. PMI_491]